MRNLAPWAPRDVYIYTSMEYSGISLIKDRTRENSRKTGHDVAQTRGGRGGRAKGQDGWRKNAETCILTHLALFMRGCSETRRAYHIFRSGSAIGGTAIGSSQ